MADDAAARSGTAQVGYQWLYAFRVGLLAISVAGILQSLVTLSWWAKLVLERWQSARDFVAQSVGYLFTSWFDVHLHWYVRETFPMTVVLTSVALLGFFRSQRSNSAFDHLFLVGASLRTIATKIGLIVIAVIIILNLQALDLAQSLFAKGVRAESMPRSIYDIVAEFGSADFALFLIHQAAALVVAFAFPLDLLIATASAGVFLVLGLVDLKPLVGPT